MNRLRFFGVAGEPCLEDHGVQGQLHSSLDVRLWVQCEFKLARVPQGMAACLPSVSPWFGPSAAAPLSVLRETGSRRLAGASCFPSFLSGGTRQCWVTFAVRPPSDPKPLATPPRPARRRRAPVRTGTLGCAVRRPGRSGADRGCGHRLQIPTAKAMVTGPMGRSP